MRNGLHLASTAATANDSGAERSISLASSALPSNL
jgi:hypothetical protein